MADSPIPKGPGDTTGPPPMPDPPSGDLSTPQKILQMMKDYAVGAIKGVTTDLAGTPVDLINLVTSPVTQALGIYSDKPVGGSKNLRELAGVGVEDANLRETVGNLLTPGGAAHAMIVGAARVGRDVDKALRLNSQMMAEGKYSPEEIRGRVFAATGVYADKSDAGLKTVVSDTGLQVDPNVFMKNLKTSQLKPSADTLDKILTGSEAEKLFTAYPALKKLKVDLDWGGSLGTASYNPGKKYPFIDIAKQESPEQFREVLLHEIQHGIQDIEKFNFGTTSNAQKQFSPEAKDKLKTLVNKAVGNPNIPVEEKLAIKRFAERYNLDAKRAEIKYLNKPGEQEARFTQENSNLSQQDLAQKVLDLIRSGKSPQSWDTRPLPTK
jgi:hypothetical protein